MSRNTFFNYFESKSDLLWVELDLAIERLGDELAAVPSDAPALAAVTAAILRAVEQIGVDRVPLALTQQDVMGTREEARTSGLARVARRADLIADFLTRQRGSARNDLIVLVAANALSGALSSAWAVWAADGIRRRPLVDYVASALAIVTEGLGASLDRQ